MSQRPPPGYPESLPPNPPPTNPAASAPADQTAAPSAPPYYASGSQPPYNGMQQQGYPQYSSPLPGAPSNYQPGAPPYSHPPPPQQYGYSHYGQQPPAQQQYPPASYPPSQYPPQQPMQHQPMMERYASGYAQPYAPPPGSYPQMPPPQGYPPSQGNYGSPYQQPQAYPGGPPPPMHALSGAYSAPPPATSMTVLPAGVLNGIEVDGNGLPVVPADIRLVGPTKYKVEEMVLGTGGDSFYVKDATNVGRYTVDGSLTSDSQKTLKNSSGVVLLKMREIRGSRKTKATIMNAEGHPILSLQKLPMMQMAVNTVHGFVGPKLEGIPAIVITGNRKSTDFLIVDAQSRQLAHVTRKKASLKKMFTSQDSYEITVQVGSAALMCLLVVALDEFYAD